MSLYAGVFALGYDVVMAGAEHAGLRARRESLLAGVAGRVLEIGGGTGANLPFYRSGVEELVITEPEGAMVRRLERKLAVCPVVARIICAGAEELPFEERSFDCVVSTLVLCTVADPARALAEVRRVLRPGGRLLFLEHVRSEEAGLARWQDRLNGLQNRIAHGCHCNRATQRSIERAGYGITELNHARFDRVPAIMRPLIIGSARRI